MRVPIFSRKTKGGAYWYCYVRTAAGKRLQRALHIRDDGSKESERAAIAAYWQEQARATSGALDQPKRTRVTLGSALIALAQQQSLAELTEHRHKTVQRATKHLLDFFGAGCDLEEEIKTTQALVPYALKAREKREAVTVRQELQVLTQAMRESGLNPPRIPRMGSLRAKPQEPLSQDDLRRFLLALRPKYKFMGLAIVSLGIRTSEYNKIDEVDWTKRMVHVAGTKTEDSARWVPIPDELWEAMVSLRDRGEWKGFGGISDRLIDHHIRQACKRAGIGPRSVNDLRGTYATALALAGVSAAERAALQGNSELMQVATYSQPHLRPEQLRSATAKLPRIQRAKPCNAGGATSAANEANTAAADRAETTK